MNQLVDETNPRLHPNLTLFIKIMFFCYFHLSIAEKIVQSPARQRQIQQIIDQRKIESAHQGVHSRWRYWWHGTDYGICMQRRWTRWRRWPTKCWTNYILRKHMRPQSTESLIRRSQSVFHIFVNEYAVYQTSLIIISNNEQNMNCNQIPIPT